MDEKDDEFNKVLTEDTTFIVDNCLIPPINSTEMGVGQLFSVSLSEILKERPDSVERLMAEPEKYIHRIIYIIKLRLQNITTNNIDGWFNKRAVVPTEPIVRITPYKSLGFTNSTQFRKDKVNRLVRLKGILTALGQIQLKQTKIVYSCPKCGKKKEIPTEKMNTELKNCPSKSCQGDFLEATPVFDNIQTIFISEAQNILKQNEVPNTIPCVIKLTNLENDYISSSLQGDVLDVLGILKVDKEGDFFIEIFYHGTLLPTEIPPADKELIFNMARENPDFLQQIGKVIHKNLYGLDKIKTLSVVFCVGLHGNLPPDIKEPCISVAFVGEPASGKTDIAKNMVKYVYRADYVPATTATAVGLAGNQEEHPITGKKIFVSGKILQCNNAILVLDEWGKDKSQDILAMSLLNPLQDSEMKINKAYFKGGYKLNMSFVFVTNPRETYFTHGDILGKQNIIHPLILERCVMSIYFPAQKSKETTQKIREFMSNRLREEVKLPITDDIIRKYIILAKQQPNPLIPKEVYEKIDKFFDEVDERYVKNANADSYETYRGVGETRSYENFIKLLTAFCRAKLKSKVEISDVEELGDICYELYWHPNYSIYGDSDPSKLSYHIEQANKIKIPQTAREIRNKILNIFDADPQKVFNGQEIVEMMKELGVPMKVVDEHIEKLRAESEIMQVRPNLFQRLQ